MRIGIEVEGRMLGLATLFVTPNELKYVYKVLESVEKDKKIHQVYIDDPGNTMDMNDIRLLELHNNGYIVTMDRTELFAPVPEHINVLLIVDNPSFQFLKGRDQFKFVKDRTVHCGTKQLMVVTKPEDFAGDMEVL